MAKKIGANSSFARNIDTAGWALFFVWVGFALLAEIGWTWGLIGTAVIILGVQALLLLKGETLDLSMGAIGIALLGGTIADMFGSTWPVIPAFLIAIGLVMLASILRSNRAEPASRGAKPGMLSD